MSHEHVQVAIDGPVAAGKGTVARLVAERVGALYVDTGAMYRATALLGKRHQLDLSEEDKLVALLLQTELKMRAPADGERDGRLCTLLLDGEDVSWQIRAEEISRGASQVAILKKVREVLVAKQQQIAANQDVVMEGRDTTYRVLPDADLKVYLTASPEVRAKRRHQELLSRGQDVSFAEVYNELLERDQRDMNRESDPLQRVNDAWELDTSELSINQVVELIVDRVMKLKQTGG